MSRAAAAPRREALLVTAAWTVAALLCFAGNSLLARAAIGGGHADALAFTWLRIVSGAVGLWILGRARGGTGRGSGSWWSAALLLGYAIAFSVAYVRLDAGTGALILFAAVNLAMLVGGYVAGERLRVIGWFGAWCSAAGLAWLLLPGATAPEPLAAACMALAGVAWAGYSLRGRRAGGPLADTTGNFGRAALIVAPLGVWLLPGSGMNATGAALAIASGAVCSGLGYAAWYAAIPQLGATRAALVQLAVPLLAAAGGVLLLGEIATTRLLVAGAAIVGGLALALGARPVPQRTT